MKWNMKVDISPNKVKALFDRMERLGVKLEDIQEGFQKGGGSGGQKINKTSSCVRLHYLPTGLIITCQKDRSLSKNRFFALRLLVDKLEEKVDPESSKRLQKLEKARKQKKRRKRRAKAPPLDSD